MNRSANELFSKKKKMFSGFKFCLDLINVCLVFVCEYLHYATVEQRNAQRDWNA